MINTAAILCIAISCAFAQKIDHYYVEMPDMLNPVISKQQRMELLEYFKADMGDSIENRFNKQTRIFSLDTINNHILVQNTDVSTFEMKLLESNNDTIIGIIKTICAPICRSTVDFYNLNWQKRPDIAFKYPKTTDWIAADKIDESEYENIRNILNADFISLSFDSISNNIIAKNNTLEFLDAKDKEQLTPIIKNIDFIYQYESNKWIKK